MSRYTIETGTVAGGVWSPGSFREAINAVDDEAAIGSVRSTLQQHGFSLDSGDHARVLSPDKQEIACLPLDQTFWSA